MSPPGQQARPKRAPGSLGCWLVAAGLLFAGGASAQPVYGPGWSAVHADAANSDYSPAPGARDLTFAWKREFRGTINLGATSDESRLYITTTAPGCHLYALDARTGETVWCSATVDRLAVSSAPLLDAQGRLFLADSTAMRAFDHDGKVLWETPIVGITLSAQFTPAGDLLFITHVGRLYVLKRDTGKAVLTPMALVPLARFDPVKGVVACMRGTPECPAANTIAVDLRSGRFFFTFWTPGKPNAGIRAMRITGGATPRVVPLWINDSLPQGSASSPDISADGQRIYLTDNAGNLHALDAATGKDIWSFPIGYEAGGSPSTSPDGVIMPAGGGSGALMAIKDRGDSAELLWRKDGVLNRGIPVQAGGGLAYAVVAAERGMDVLVLDAATGAQLDRERLVGARLFTIGTTTGPGGMVYAPTIAGQVFAFKPAADAR